MGNTSLRANSFELQTLQQASFKLQREKISKKWEPLMMHVWPAASSFALHESTFSRANTARFSTQKNSFFFFFLPLYLLRIGEAESRPVRSRMGFLTRGCPCCCCQLTRNYRRHNRKAGAQTQPMQNNPGVLSTPLYR